MFRRDVESLRFKFIIALTFVGAPMLLLTFVVTVIPAIEGALVVEYLRFVSCVIIGLAILYAVVAVIRYGARYQDEVEVIQPPSPVEQFRRQALRLAEKNGVPRATRRLNKYQVGTPRIIIDVGILVYEHEHDVPHIVRHKPLPLDAQFLRPYFLIWPLRRSTVDITFEILDANDHIVIRDTHKHKLRGRTGVTCESWLPMKGLSVNQKDCWLMRAYIDGELMADHHLRWGTFRWGELKSESPTDGELSKRLTEALESGQIDTIGLDELFGYEPQKIGRGAS